MNYQPKFGLARRSNTEGMPDDEAPVGLLVGEEAVLEWTANESYFGHDKVALFPAYRAGNRVWLLRYSWRASGGYCAWGSSEEVLPYKNGMHLIEAQVGAQFFSDNAKFVVKENMRTRYGWQAERSVADALSGDWREAKALIEGWDLTAPLSLQVAAKVATWDEGRSQYSLSRVTLQPALLNGVPCWLKTSEAPPVAHYDGGAPHECVIPFDEGLKQAVQREQFFWTAEKRFADAKAWATIEEWRVEVARLQMARFRQRRRRAEEAAQRRQQEAARKQKEAGAARRASGDLTSLESAFVAAGVDLAELESWLA